MKNFSREQTTIIKGIAILLLFAHHGLPVVTKPFLVFGMDLVSNTMSYGKMCVALFTILSGYGMYLSFSKSADKNYLLFSAKHIIKIYMTFWLCFLLGVGLTSWVTGNLLAVYAGNPDYYILCDFMGLAYLTKTAKYAGAWWYITAIVIYYTLFPIFHLIIKKLGKWNWLLLVPFSVIPLFTTKMGSINIYMICFVDGMILAELNVFNKMLNAFNDTKVKQVLKIVALGITFVGLSLLRQGLLVDIMDREYKMDWLIAIVMICFINELTSLGTNWITKAFAYLGKYSFEMFILHSLFIKYFGTYTFFTLEPVYIMIRITVASLLAAMGVGVVKKIICFDKIGAFVCKKPMVYAVIAVIAVTWAALYAPMILPIHY